MDAAAHGDERVSGAHQDRPAETEAARFENRDTTIGRPAAGGASALQFDLAGMRPAELYDAWLFAAADATLALAAWRSAGRADKPDAHAAYVAALDRESHAAKLLENRLRGSVSPLSRTV